MNAVLKYRKKPLFRILSVCILALLAGLALAPWSGLSAKNAALLADGSNVVDDAIESRPIAQPKVIPRHRAAPHAEQISTPGSESQDEQAPVAQPQQDRQSEFDEETTFALGDVATDHRYASLGAARFSTSGGSGGGSSGGSSRSQNQQSAAGGSASGPHIGAADKKREPTSATAPSDLPNTNGNPYDDTDTGSGEPPADHAGLPVASVPEPSSIALLAIGLLGLAFARRFYS